MDIKLGKSQQFKIIEAGGFPGALLVGPLMKVAVPQAKNVLAPLATTSSASAINGAVQRKMYGRGVVGAEKGIPLVILNEDISGIIRS